MPIDRRRTSLIDEEAPIFAGTAGRGNDGLQMHRIGDVCGVPHCDLPCAAGVVALEARVESAARGGAAPNSLRSCLAPALGRGSTAGLGLIG